MSMDLFAQLFSFENLYYSYCLARSCKQYRPSILKFSCSLEENILSLRNDLLTGTYTHGSYREFVVCDSKKRIIKAAPFRDRVLHHAVHSIIEPIFEKTFIYDSYACRKGKGVHTALRRLRSYIHSYGSDALTIRERERERFVLPRIYCLKCDIKKYFDSVDHEILLSLLAKRITDVRILRLCEIIIRSIPAGIPIGNLTSQLFANIYLNELDHYVKRVLREKHYIRYMDDFVILGTDKKRLCTDKQHIQTFLYETLKLELHPKKSEIFFMHCGIDFLGYRVFPHHVTLRKSTVKRRKKKLKELQWRCCRGEVSQSALEDALRAWCGYAKHARGWHTMQSMRETLFKIKGVAN